MHHGGQDRFASVHGCVCVIVRVLWEFMCAYNKLDKHAEVESDCTMMGRTDLHACMGACLCHC